jgi:hypothetical protein
MYLSMANIDNVIAGYIPQGFPTKVYAVWSSHPSLIDLISVSILDEESKL